jgi:hypothetical protein
MLTPVLSADGSSYEAGGEWGGAKERIRRGLMPQLNERDGWWAQISGQRCQHRAYPLQVIKKANRPLNASPCVEAAAMRSRAKRRERD